MRSYRLCSFKSRPRNIAPWGNRSYHSKVILCFFIETDSNIQWITGADLGFLERPVHMYKNVGVSFANFISLFLNIL